MLSCECVAVWKVETWAPLGHQCEWMESDKWESPTLCERDW